MKIILIGHGNFPYGLVDAARMIIGELDFLKSISFGENDDISGFEEKIKIEIENSDEDILVMADLFGGSPFNIAMKLASQHKKNKIKVLAGVNLPIVLELSSLLLNNCDIDFIVSKLKTSGKEAIVEGFQELNFINND
ncbi:PTS sugar transporter subunit IIA [Thermovenabulum gondwanense]|uniref:PTS system mannose-specific EIIAB component n=1 Tax=Thermovenabulum gondwanense TaxID=520767 RepID=A0A161PVH8_9FIRM|nr:PTS sugar transporter subunit IIA [Thermovenabulum gondwanense]KYO66935.1 PTS system mannose-specific EIIAB component [Thermovenabulum gondwanense]